MLVSRTEDSETEATSPKNQPPSSLSSFPLSKLARSTSTVFLVYFCILFATEADAQTLRYRVYLGGLPVGIATVRLQVTATSYEISGSASTDGVAALFSHWKTQFEANGLIVDNVGILEKYQYDEQFRHKHTQLSLLDGYVQVTKNGKRRQRRPVGPGVDVLTGLFVHPRCRDQLLHTGRDYYTLTQLETTDSFVCHYIIFDDDGDPHRAELVFEERDGLLVPARFKLGRLLAWTMVLVEVQHS